MPRRARVEASVFRAPSLSAIMMTEPVQRHRRLMLNNLAVLVLFSSRGTLSWLLTLACVGL